MFNNNRNYFYPINDQCKISIAKQLIQTGEKLLNSTIISNISLDEKEHNIKSAIDIFSKVELDANHKIVADAYFFISECYQALYDIGEARSKLNEKITLEEDDFDSEVSGIFQHTFLHKKIYALIFSLKIDITRFNKNEMLDCDQVMDKYETLSDTYSQLGNTEKATYYLEAADNFERSFNKKFNKTSFTR